MFKIVFIILFIVSIILLNVFAVMVYGRPLFIFDIVIVGVAVHMICKIGAFIYRVRVTHIKQTKINDMLDDEFNNLLDDELHRKKV